jgi:hypothetical protein
MTVEYRVTNSGTGTFAAEMRFDEPDDALWRQGIEPGWHAFKRSKTRAVCERAIVLDRANRAAELGA